MSIFKGHSLRGLAEMISNLEIMGAEKPDSARFVKYKEGTVIDEEKSVRWNREEVERCNLAYEAEAKRLQTIHREKITGYEDEIKSMLIEKYKLSRPIIDMFWARAYSEDHEYGTLEVLDECEDYCSFYLEVKKVEAQQG